jgi:hypothetical protein
VGVLAVRVAGCVCRFAMELISVVRSLNVLAGFCYTQFADTYQEANGLLYADRTPKFPLQDISLAVQGPRTTRDVQWSGLGVSG